MRSLSFYSCVLLLCLISSLPAVAQDRASINGTVTDSSGGVVVNADVNLRSEATGLYRTTQTSSSGFYEFPALAVGRYTVTIIRPRQVDAEQRRSGAYPGRMGNVGNRERPHRTSGQHHDDTQGIADA